MTPFDFEAADAWETSTDSGLPVGNHQVVIREPKGTWTKDRSKPQIELRVENAERSRLRDFITITPNTMGKVVQVFDAAGVARPKDGEYDTETGEIYQQALNRLNGKRVGVVVHEEEGTDRSGQPKMWPRVRGYVEVQRITGDVPIDTSGLPAVGASSSTGTDDIPF